MLLANQSWGSNDDGPDMVCVHGVSQRGLVFARLAGELAAAGHHTIAVDLRGHGASSHAPPFDIAAHVADVVETATTTGVGAATWIGHSFGGRVLAGLAARFPKRVGALVLIEPVLRIAPELARRSVEWSPRTGASRPWTGP